MSAEVEVLRAQLVDAVTTRLWSGVPLNEYDLTALGWVARFLGMDERFNALPSVADKS